MTVEQQATYSRNLQVSGSGGISNRETGKYESLGTAYGWEYVNKDEEGNTVEVGPSTAKALANARLWAAAPEMIEALLSIQAVCANEKSLSVSGAVLDQIEGYLAEPIAKALGGQS